MLPDWDRCFPHCEPIGYHLRAAFADRWVRFHSLPGAKRYPEDDAEFAEVLARHNAILGELTRPGERVVLVTTGYSESPAPSRSYPNVVAFDPGAAPWRTIAMHRIEDAFAEPNYWHLFGSLREWRPGSSILSFGWSPLTWLPTCSWWHRIAGGCSILTMAEWT